MHNNLPIIGAGQGRESWSPLDSEAGSERGIGTAAAILFFVAITTTALVGSILFLALRGAA